MNYYIFFRIRNTTPEPIRRNIVENTITNVRAASSHHRSTMMPCDFAIPQSKNFILIFY